MNIVIVGIGKLGDILTQYISKEGHDVTVIDRNTKLIDEIVNEYDVFGIVGNGANCEILKEAGADKCDLIIACTESDELNILSCLVAKRLGARHAIARVRDPEYAEQMGFLRSELGLSMIINPEFETALEIARIVQFPDIIKIEPFGKGRVDLMEIKISDGHPLAGMSLIRVSEKFDASILVCAVQRGDEVYIPSGNFIIQPDDIIHVTATHQELSSFFRELGILNKKIRTVILVGGGNISYYLAERLIRLGIRVKIMEIDPARCEELAEGLPKATVINCDGTDCDILTDEGIDSADAVVTLTGIDEENIITSMYAQNNGVRKIVTKITRMSLMKIVPTIGLTCSTVSPRLLSTNKVLRYMRGIHNSHGSGIETLYKIIDDRAEAIEFSAKSNLDFLGIMLKDLKLKPNLLISCIIRGNKIIYPNGSSTIELGDRVVVITTNPVLRDLKDIIA